MSVRAKKMLSAVFATMIIICIFVALVFGRGGKSDRDSEYTVVASHFAAYDFLRAVIGDTDGVELVYLIGPGKDAHSYIPTAGDLITIQNADFFVYVGGEAENWSDKILDLPESRNIKTLCISDFVDKISEHPVDGAQDEGEDEDEPGSFDEHIWTSPDNAIKMVNALEKVMEEVNAQNSREYRKNADEYISKIRQVDKKIQDVVDNRVRDRLVFADRMPMQYFVNYYNLQVSAAFSGCSTETEPSAKTIAYLQNKVKAEKIPVVLYIELNPGRVAQTIAEETGAKALQIETLHNVTLEDFNNGETWVSLMTRNIDVLKQALDY